MGHESAAFRSLFRAILVTTGDGTEEFNPLRAKDFKPRLYRVQLVETTPGSRKPDVRQVPRSIDSLTLSDTYMVDAGEVILVWHGRKQIARDKIKVSRG
jgi:hypothetical protein